MTVSSCQQHFRAQRRTDAGRAEQNLRLTITDVIDDIELYIITVQIFLDRMVDFSGLETLRKRNIGKSFQINPILHLPDLLLGKFPPQKLGGDNQDDLIRRQGLDFIIRMR